MTEDAPGTDAAIAARDRLIDELLARGASDVLCKAGSPASFRVNGQMTRSDEIPLDAGAVASLARTLLSSDHQQRLVSSGSVVTAVSVAGRGRFRVAAFRQRGSVALVIHAVPDDQRVLDELGLPDAARRLAELSSGLVLVASPVGNGATTTLGAMVDHINRTRSCHVVTVEDPIEILHRDREALISQLEVGADIASIVDGVRSASRIDADVLAVSDLSNREIAVSCLDAVSRGRLVLATIAGSTAVDVTKQFLELFRNEERPVYRQSFSRALAGIVVQRLLRDPEGEPVLIGEALVKTAKIEQVLAAEDRMGELDALLREGTFHGMRTIDQSLCAAVKAGRLDEATALANAVDAEDLRIELLR